MNAPIRLGYRFGRAFRTATVYHELIRPEDGSVPTQTRCGRAITESWIVSSRAMSAEPCQWCARRAA